MSAIRPELQLELPIDGPPPAAAGGQFALPLDDAPVPFRLHRSRRSGVSLAVDERGLRVSAPRGMTLPQIEQAIRDGSRAIGGKLAHREAGPGKLGLPRRWQDGTRFPLRGKEVLLRLDAARPQAGLADGTLFLPLPADAGERQIKDRTEGWLQGEARTALAQRLGECARRCGMRAPAWRLSFAGGTWGGADADGALRLSWRLIHLSETEIDRVLMCHLEPLARRQAARDLWEPDAEAVPA